MTYLTCDPQPVRHPTATPVLRRLSLACVALSLLAAGAGARSTGAPDPSDPLRRPCSAVVLVRSEGKPVPGARLVAGSRPEWTADHEGRLCVPELPDAGESLEALVVAEGFVVTRVTMPLGGHSELIVELPPAFGEELVVSATRFEQRLVDVPVHIQRLGRDTIEASSARTLADAIEYAAGVRVESNCQNCNFSQVRMLGLEGPYSQILVDGQPSLSSLALVYGIEQIPAATLEGIEVTKGGGSALYGAGAVGGTINLLPRAADHTGLHAELTALETGGESGISSMVFAEATTEERRHGLTALGQLDELDPADLDGDGYSEVTSRELENFNVRYQGLLLEDRAQLAVDLNRTDSFRRGGDLIRFALPPHETALTEAIGTQREAGTVRWLHQTSARFDLRAAGSFSTTTRDSYYGADFDPDAYGVTEAEVLLADLQLNRYLDRSTLTFGGQFLRDDLLDIQAGYGRRLEETYDTASVFAQEDRRIGERLTLLYGLRVDDHTALDDPVVSPRLSALWAPRSDVSIRASVARGFRAPATFDEDLHIELVGGGQARLVANDPDLEEETSLASLLSAEWKPTFGRLGSAAFEVVLFRTELDDLFFDREADDPTTPAFELVKTNLGEATVEGIELAAAYRFGARFFVEAAFVQQSARRADPEPDFGSRDFFRTPEQYGSLNLQAELPGGISMFGGLLYTGSMTAPHYAGFIPEDRLETTPTFLTVSVGLRRSFQVGARQIEISLSGRNLTDEYQEDLDRGPLRDSAYVYGPRLPRSLNLSVGFEW